MLNTMADSPAATGLAQLKIDRQSSTGEGSASANAPVKRRRRLPWRWILGAALLGVAAAIALAPRPVEVRVSSVLQSTPAAQYAQLTASGYVVAQRRAAVASKASGRLVELTVREGSVLKKGELIARIDAADVQASIGAATAGVRLAEASARQAQSGVQQAQASDFHSYFAATSFKD